jgi:hypothetical protein
MDEIKIDILKMCKFIMDNASYRWFKGEYYCRDCNHFSSRFTSTDEYKYGNLKIIQRENLIIKKCISYEVEICFPKYWGTYYTSATVYSRNVLRRGEWMKFLTGIYENYCAKKEKYQKEQECIQKQEYKIGNSPIDDTGLFEFPVIMKEKKTK